MLGTSHQKVPPKKKSHNKHEKLQKKVTFQIQREKWTQQLKPYPPQN